MSLVTKITAYLEDGSSHDFLNHDSYIQGMTNMGHLEAVTTPTNEDNSASEASEAPQAASSEAAPTDEAYGGDTLGQSGPGQSGGPGEEVEGSN